MQRGEFREPVMTLVFTWLTCGIYYYYWMYVASEEMNAALGRKEYDPAMEIVLSLVTCGIWLIWWDWRMSESIVELEQRWGLVPKMEPALMFVTNFLGLGPLFYQRSMNHAWQFGDPNRATNQRLEQGYPGPHQPSAPQQPHRQLSDGTAQEPPGADGEWKDSSPWE